MKMTINWEVGSTWYADDFKSDGKMPEYMERIVPSSELTLLSTCRSAISIVLDRIPMGRRALVPSFTCHSVVEPFVKAGYDVRPYPLKENLEIDICGLSELVDCFRPDVILIHGYFGFDTVGNASAYLELCRNRGIVVIEDRTQTMFSTFRRPVADYVTGSIRKWLPVPDGAFLSGLSIDGLSEDELLVTAKIEAMQEKCRYIFAGEGRKEDFMPKFAEAERILDSRTEAHAISGFTMSALGGLDIEALALSRRNNYNALTSRLALHPEISLIFPRATDSDVPFLLPLYISEGRKDFQSFMARHNVYPTIIWTCPAELEQGLDPVGRHIYDNILCFHVDQRYGVDDMNHVADIIDSYFEQ